LLCAHQCKKHPFQFERSTGNNIFPLACLFDSLVRVSRRVKVPHFQSVKSLSLPRRAGSLLGKTPTFTSALCSSPLSTFVCPALAPEGGTPDNAAGLALTKMEALSLSLSRLQVLCHSLSKVLFKLSLTLLVCYRSSHFVFNFGRHIPAA